MTFDEHPDRSRNPTPRVSDTRERILLATAALLRERGAAATTLDDICVASATSKSQLCDHVGDKDAIVLAAVEARAVGLLADQPRGVDRPATTGRASRPRALESAVETLLHSSRNQDAGVQICVPEAMDQRKRGATTS